MKMEVDRWLVFAEEDRRMARLALDEAIYNQVCFHSQQCVEKALKAAIISRGEFPPRSHKIADLLAALESFAPNRVAVSVFQCFS
jgi:HEPN domain-containing protein